MSELMNSNDVTKPRLKFIDMARSIAILLMIEGHFTGASLSSDYRTYDYSLFRIWHLTHGLTAPLFFTITGVIFVYLLTSSRDVRFLDNIRVSKGLKRILQLLFWGYLIQLNLWAIGKSFYYGTEINLNWFYAFHVLQSIAFGIAFLILIYGVYKWLNWGALQWYYLIAGLGMFALYGIMKEYINLDKELIEEGVKTLPSYWPNNAPAFIQNMFYGQHSDFSFIRISGYTILGGMVGCLIRVYEHRVKELWFGGSFIIIGLLISFFVRDWLVQVDNLIEWVGLTDKGSCTYTATSLSRFGQVIVLLGILILIDKFFEVKAKLFLKIGQNTFPIYVVHVIILYGGILGFGLKPNLFNRSLDPWFSVSISVIALFTFVLMVKYIEPLEAQYNKVLRYLRIKKP